MTQTTNNSATLLEQCIVIANQQLPYTGWTKWDNARFKPVKDASTTEKGHWGEYLTSNMMTKLGYPSKVVNGGIGDYDILNQSANKTIEIEHKLATEDGRGSFQFNAIDPDKSWDIVYCLGVSPNSLYFTVKTRQWCYNNLTTSMSKAGGGYKMTIPQSSMTPLTDTNLLSVLTRLHQP